MKKLFTILSISFVSFGFSQGWNQKKGEGYFQLSEKIYSTNMFFDDNSEQLELGGSMSSMTTDLYAEYGFSDKLMGIAKIPLVYNAFNSDDEIFNSTNESELSKFGLGEVELGLAYAIQRDKDLVLNIYAFQTIAAGAEETETGIRTSDNEGTQKVILGIGYSGFYPLYMNGSLGYTNRNNGYSDAIEFSLGAGYKFDFGLIISLKVFGQSSLENGDDEIKNLWYANNIGYIAYGPELIYELKEKAGLFFNFMTGAGPRNVFAAGSISFGAYLKLKK